MRSGKGRVAQVIERKVLRIMLPEHEWDRFKTLVEQSGMPEAAYLSLLMGETPEANLETQEDYLRAIHLHAGIAASLSAAMAMRFAGRKNETPEAA